MNEIYNYDPETYHATLTHSVYVRLEGSTLRLSKPNKNISRRAVYNEPKPEVTYVSQKIYELTESKVSVPSLHLILTEYFETSLFFITLVTYTVTVTKTVPFTQTCKRWRRFWKKKNPCYTVNERHDFSFVSLRKVTPGRVGNRSLLDFLLTVLKLTVECIILGCCLCLRTVQAAFAFHFH